MPDKQGQPERRVPPPSRLSQMAAALLFGCGWLFGVGFFGLVAGAGAREVLSDDSAWEVWAGWVFIYIGLSCLIPLLVLPFHLAASVMGERAGTPRAHLQRDSKERQSRLAKLSKELWATSIVMALMIPLASLLEVDGPARIVVGLFLSVVCYFGVRHILSQRARE